MAAAAISELHLDLDNSTSCAKEIHNFTIRGFTKAVREHNIRKTYPFSEARLERCLRLGLEPLGPLEPPPWAVRGADKDTPQEHIEVQFEVENTAVERKVEDSAGVENGTQIDDLGTGEKQNCIEDKASDTGADEQVDGQQQNVCPVCAAFTSHSVTALNAHMDSCLASDKGTDQGKQEAVIKVKGKGSKVQKMRSITDIIASEPALSKQSEKEISTGRQLRSRSRSILSPRSDTRPTRGRPRESDKGSEKRKRHFENSQEVTSSYTPSNSSGTYKTQDVSGPEQKPVDSQASNLEPLTDLETAPVNTTDKPEGRNQEEAAVPPEDKQVHDVDTEPTVTEVREEQEAENDTLQESPLAQDKQGETPRNQPQVASAPTSAVPNAALLVPGTGTVRTPRLGVPLYESNVTSIRSTTAATSTTGYNNVQPTWKAAVVLATLGAERVDPGDYTVISGNRKDSTTQKCTSHVDTARMSEALNAAIAHTFNNKAPVRHVQQAGNQYPGLGASQFGTCSTSRMVRPNVPVPVPVFGSVSRSHHIHKVPMWASNSERVPVIDVEQESARTSTMVQDGGKGAEKPVQLRLLGQNVMVPMDSTTASTSKDGSGCKNNHYRFQLGGHSSGDYQQHHGHHCCCNSRSEHVAYMPGNGSHILPISLPGTWRLNPNGTVTQSVGQKVCNHHVGQLGQQVHIGQLGQTVHLGQLGQPLRNKDKQPAQAQANGDLPPWLAAAKKQKEAEANIIVIDDDEPEEKVDPKTVSKSSEVQIAGASNSNVNHSRASTSQNNTGASTSQKRLGNPIQQPVEKAIRTGTTDSPATSANRPIQVLVPVPLLVPTAPLAAGAATGSKRGQAAQHYRQKTAILTSSEQGAARPGYTAYQQPVMQRAPVTNLGNATAKDSYSLVRLEDGHFLLVNANMVQDGYELDNNGRLASQALLSEQVVVAPGAPMLQRYGNGIVLATTGATSEVHYPHQERVTQIVPVHVAQQLQGHPLQHHGQLRGGGAWGQKN